MKINTGSGSIEVDDSLVDDSSASSQIKVTTGSGGVDIRGI